MASDWPVMQYSECIEAISLLEFQCFPQYVLKRVRCKHNKKRPILTFILTKFSPLFLMSITSIILPINGQIRSPGIFRLATCKGCPRSRHSTKNKSIVHSPPRMSVVSISQFISNTIWLSERMQWLLHVGQWSIYTLRLAIINCW